MKISDGLIAVICLLAGFFIGKFFYQPAPEKMTYLEQIPAEEPKYQADNIAVELTQQPKSNQKQLVTTESDLPTKTETNTAFQENDIEREDNNKNSEDLSQQLALLQQKLDELESENFFLNQQLNDAQQALAEKPESDKPKLTRATINEIEKTLPAPFSSVIDKGKDSLVEKFNAFTNQPEDLDWGFNMAQNIKDFITSHENSYDIDQLSVICKTDTCEIRGFELTPKAWRLVSSQLKVQPWWRFNSSHSSYKRNTELGNYFYTLASINKKRRTN